MDLSISAARTTPAAPVTFHVRDGGWHEVVVCPGRGAARLAAACLLATDDVDAGLAMYRRLLSPAWIEEAVALVRRFPVPEHGLPEDLAEWLADLTGR